MTAAAATWAIRYTDDETGESAQIDDLTAAEAQSLLPEMVALDPSAHIVDLLDELRSRLPLDGRVRHTTTGRLGTIVAQPGSCAPLSYVDPDLPVAHQIDSYHPRGLVCVQFDGRPHGSWFAANWIEPVGASHV